MEQEVVKRKRGRPRKIRPEEVEASNTAEVTGRAPGTKYYEIAGDGSKIHKKVRWTMKDVKSRFPMVAIFPEQTLTITWNGVSVTVFEGVETEIPSPHAEIYRERQRKLHEISRRTRAVVDGQMVHVLPNAGGLED